MNYPPNVWNQLKGKTCQELMKALLKDGWERDVVVKTEQVFFRAGRRVSLHVHPKKTYGPKLLKALLDDIGWSEDEMRKLKLIK